MSQVMAISRRELYGMLTQRWILILLALLGMELLIGVGVRINNVSTFDLGNVAVTMSFLGSLAMMGLSLDAVTRERTSASLDLILTRPVSRRQVIVAKLLSYLVISVPVAVLGILMPLGVAALLGVQLDLDRFPLDLTLLGTVFYLALFATLGVAVSLFCRTLQSAFAVGGAIWVTVSPLVWQFLVLRGLSRQLNDTAMTWLNVLNPMGAYYSAIYPVESFGAKGAMGLSVPVPVAYGILTLEMAALAILALLLFDRQEEPGYQE